VSPKARNALLTALAALLVAAAAFLGSLAGNDDTVVTETQTEIANPAGTVTTKVDSGDPGTKPDVVVKAPATAVAEAEAGLKKSHEGEKKEDLTQGQLNRLKVQSQKDLIPKNAGLGASDSIPGCVTRFVVNQSFRSVTPRLFVLHTTVSPNRPGWGDVNAVVGLFNRPAFSAATRASAPPSATAAAASPARRGSSTTARSVSAPAGTRTSRPGATAWWPGTSPPTRRARAGRCRAPRPARAGSASRRR
jgi:hypothetical protein